MFEPKHSTATSSCGQTTVNKRSADSLYNPYKWHGPQTRLKMFQKIPQKFHDKAVQSNMLWLNLNNIGEMSILQSAHKQGNPSFHFYAPGKKRWYLCTQIASAVQKCVPCLLQFCTGFVLHLESENEKRPKTVDLQTTKNIQIKPTLFQLFLDEFL